LFRWTDWPPSSPNAREALGAGAGIRPLGPPPERLTFTAAERKLLDRLSEDTPDVVPSMAADVADALPGRPDSTVWWFLHSKGSSTNGYNVPEMDTMLDDARAELDPKKREALYHKIVDRDLEDCPKIYHVNVNYVRLHKKGLAGFNPSPQEYIELFTNVRWEA